MDDRNHSDDPTLIEYRVRPVTRYIVTRYEGHGPERKGNAPREHGEFDNYETAYAVGYALCRAEHQRLGWVPDDSRIQYPTNLPPGLGVAIGVAGAPA